MGERATSLVDEWTARARAALAEVNRGVRDTLERLHEGEDLVIDEAFGAMTAAEKEDIEKDKRELAELEAKAAAAKMVAKVSPYTPAMLRWIHGKVTR